MTEREKLIIEFYENGEIPFIIKLIDYIKGRLDKYEHKYHSRMGRN